MRQRNPRENSCIHSSPAFILTMTFLSLFSHEATTPYLPRYLGTLGRELISLPCCVNQSIGDRPLFPASGRSSKSATRVSDPGTTPCTVGVGAATSRLASSPFFSSCILFPLSPFLRPLRFDRVYSVPVSVVVAVIAFSPWVLTVRLD